MKKTFIAAFAAVAAMGITGNAFAAIWTIASPVTTTTLSGGFVGNTTQQVAGTTTVGLNYSGSLGNSVSAPSGTTTPADALCFVETSVKPLPWLPAVIVPVPTIVQHDYPVTNTGSSSAAVDGSVNGQVEYGATGGSFGFESNGSGVAAQDNNMAFSTSTSLAAVSAPGYQNGSFVDVVANAASDASFGQTRPTYWVGYDPIGCDPCTGGYVGGTTVLSNFTTSSGASSGYSLP